MYACVDQFVGDAPSTKRLHHMHVHVAAKRNYLILLFKGRLTRFATANFYNRSLVHLANFESARYLRLENTRVVILLGNTTDKVHVLVPVTAQGILGTIGVVQVDVLVI